ncbi:uncharacterized protein LOC117320378 [Pecten maximus]|nr:uncharacterized protein LOC117320378 [Pecten maximus]
MGHTLSVHRQYYRLQEQTLELAKVSKLLIASDAGHAHKYAGKSLDNIALEDVEDFPDLEDEPLNDKSCPYWHIIVIVSAQFIKKKIDDSNPLIQKMRLGVFLLSGNNSLVEEFHHRLPVWSSIPGKTQRRNSMGVISKKWMQFCLQRQNDPLKPTVTQILEFLNMLFQSGLGYSALNTAKSAICSFTSVNTTTSDVGLGNHPLIKRFMKGVFCNRPALPKYSTTWDVSIVLRNS